MWFWKRRVPVVVAMLVWALFAAACGDVVVPEVVAPATPTPAPTPTATPAPVIVDAPTPTPRPWENEPGITEDTIRVGVIYDTEVNPVADAIAAAAPEAVEAWAMAINSEGGIAGGRSVEVVRIETRPLLGDHAEAIDRACNSDVFALIGSTALFDSLGLDQLNGAPCSLPDFPATVQSTERLASRVTTSTNPVMSSVWQAGWARYFAREDLEAVEAAAALYLEFPVSVINGERTIEAASAQGYEFVAREQLSFSADYQKVAADINKKNVDMLTWTADGGRLVDLLAAFEEAGERPKLIDCGMLCYSDAWVAAAGDAGNGVSTWLATFPLEESDSVPELTRYLFWRGSVATADSEPSSIGVLAWASALLFEEAVNAAIGLDTSDYDPDNITRDRVITATSGITEWDARGLHGTSNPAEGIPSSCVVVLTLENGVWERSFPNRRGELNCAEANLVELTITQGLSEADETLAPAPGEEVPEPEPTPIE